MSARIRKKIEAAKVHDGSVPKFRAPATEQGKLIQRVIERGTIASASDIPEGAVLADPEKIRSHSWCPSIPPWYDDRTFFCQDCRKPEVWRAAQQRWWYEIARGDIDTTAIRCRACRIRKRSEDKANTEKLRAARLKRGERKASEIAANLRACGPLTTLRLSQSRLLSFQKRNIRTIGELVAMPRAEVPQLTYIERLIKPLGLCIAGAPVPRDGGVPHASRGLAMD